MLYFSFYILEKSSDAILYKRVGSILLYFMVYPWKNRISSGRQD